MKTLRKTKNAPIYLRRLQEVKRVLNSSTIKTLEQLKSKISCEDIPNFILIMSILSKQNFIKKDENKRILWIKDDMPTLEMTRKLDNTIKEIVKIRNTKYQSKKKIVDKPDKPKMESLVEKSFILTPTITQITLNDQFIFIIMGGNHKLSYNDMDISIKTLSPMEARDFLSSS